MSVPTVPEDLVTLYAALSSAGKSLFRRLLEEGSVERAQDRIPSKLWDAEYVRYDGTIHEVERSYTGQDLVSRWLTARPVTADAVDESDLVRSEDLSEVAQEAFETAVDDRFTARGERLPGQLREVRFVAYEGSYYRLSVTVGDLPIWELWVRTVAG